MQPLFEIRQLFFPVIFVLVNQEYDSKKHFEPELGVFAELRKIPRKKNMWSMNLTVFTPPDMEKYSFPYSFHLMANAVLEHTVPVDMTKEDIKKMKQLLYVNGASVTYSAVRDRLLLLTGNTPYAPYCLPSYRFDPEHYHESSARNKGISDQQ